MENVFVADYSKLIHFPPGVEGAQTIKHPSKVNRETFSVEDLVVHEVRPNGDLRHMWGEACTIRKTIGIDLDIWMAQGLLLNRKFIQRLSPGITILCLGTIVSTGNEHFIAAIHNNGLAQLCSRKVSEAPDALTMAAYIKRSKLTP